MNKSITWIVYLMLFFAFMHYHPNVKNAEATTKIAFIRNHQLWIKIGKTEKKITTTGNVVYPKWSNDGNWLAYLQDSDLMIYNINDKKQIRIFENDVLKFEWSKTEPILAFQSNKVLNIANTKHIDDKRFENVSLGVGNFSWTPNGQDFLISSTANPLPTGWGSVELFLVPKDANLSTKKIKHLFTLPPQSDQFFAIGTSGFKWSSDGAWISFIGYPTASLSADGDTLCVLSNDGKTFINVGEMLLNEGWMNWSKKDNTLAYIKGTGRVALENKQLTLAKIPFVKNNSITPNGYVDWDFSWHSNQMITVSRAHETKWENEQKKRPLPVLFNIDLTKNQQTKITHPKEGFGDYHPMVQNKKLLWLRSNREKAELWQAENDGENAKKIIKEIDAPSGYYEMYDWNKVLSVYE